MSIADYMQLCLLHPQHGYYARKDPFGQAGDFVTAPEVSQMFGEVLGLCLAQAWLDQGQPDCTIVELGPGRGTLMRDVLRATAKVPGFPQKAILVEASAHLRGIQAETLAGQDVEWAETVSDLPMAPILLLANEFFDALPVRQFQRATKGWSERRINLDGDSLVMGLAPEMPVDMLAHRLSDTGAAEIVEVSPDATVIMREVAKRVALGGAALILDYGDWRSSGDTFQAIENHAPVDPLARPGIADLTAHVDFEALALASHACAVSPMVPQGTLLERLGITARAQALAAKLDGDALKAHIAAHRRLTHPEEMGSLFKAIALSPKGVPPLPGFEMPASTN